MRDAFNRAAERANTVLGSGWALVLAVVVVVVWAVTGPLFMVSDTWQLAAARGRDRRSDGRAGGGNGRHRRRTAGGRVPVTAAASSVGPGRHQVE